MSKQYGLKLTLGGAPNTPHILPAVGDQPGVPGFYRPDQATPVGGPGECSLERAQAADADPNCPVELVELTDSEATKLRGATATTKAAAKTAAKQNRKVEPDRAKDELAAISGGGTE